MVDELLDSVIETLRLHREEIRGFGAVSLAVFGSVARGEARPDSDVDVLVKLERGVTLFGFVRLKNHLEELLGRSVDLVTPGGLREYMRAEVLAEAVPVYEEPQATEMR